MDLAALATTMDEAERLRMAESGVDSEEYRRFLEVSEIPGQRPGEIPGEDNNSY